MQYEYPKLEKSLIISNYEIIEDNMIITFLDGYKVKYVYSRALEEEILFLMLEQAEMRNSYYLHKNKTSLEYKIHNSFFPIVGAFLGSNLSLLFEFGINENLIMLILLESLLIAVLWAAYYYRSWEIKELEKYNLYLNYKDNFDRIDNSEILKYINASITELNINTIDKISYENMRVLVKESSRILAK